MQHLIRIAPPYDMHGVFHPGCPQCGAETVRTVRRVRDRWLSLLLPLRRYRCQAAECGWEGNFLTGNFLVPALLLGGTLFMLWARSVDAPASASAPATATAASPTVSILCGVQPNSPVQPQLLGTAASDAPRPAAELADVGCPLASTPAASDYWGLPGPGNK